MESHRIKIGMGQLLVEGGEPERNLKRAEEMIAQAAQQQCEIVLLPECLDLAWTHPSAKNEAKPIPGEHSSCIVRAAKQHKVYVCAGLTENDNGRVYNSAIFVNPEGEILLKYRKINVLSVGQEFYEVGTSLSVAETPLGTIGVNICSDNYTDGLPIGHTLARMGAQLILSPSSWTVDYSALETDDPYGEKWIKPYQTLAKLYDLAVIGTTSVGVIVGGPYEGKKMVGCSLAVDQNGIIARGRYNEFAGELVTSEVQIVPRHVKGTDIGQKLDIKGVNFEHDAVS